MAKHLTCYKDSDGKHLKNLKARAKNKDFFGGMKNYKNMTEFDNRYDTDGASGDKKTDWALFWIKCYLGKNKEKQKKVYLAEYEKEHSAWMKRRLKLTKSGYFPYMMTGVVGGHSADDPPTVYLYEGYENAPSECKLWVFTP
jgi:hypothetical protein